MVVPPAVMFIIQDFLATHLCMYMCEYVYTCVSMSVSVFPYEVENCLLNL